MFIRCGTFNLYQFAAPPFSWYEKENFYTADEWQAKKAWIISRLKEMDCDVIGFQEVFSIDELKALVNAAGYAYFDVVEQPEHDLHDTLIFTSPVVAVAARFPLSSVQAVRFSQQSEEQLPVEADFKYSRTPVRAEVELPGFGNILVYVSHLKSKRAIELQPDYDDADPWKKKVLATMQARSAGHVAALLQRGAEAYDLYMAVSTQIEAQPDKPILVLGDMNDDPDSIPVEALSNRAWLFEVDGVKYQNLPMEAKVSAYQYKLYDAFNLAPNQDGLKRTPTHYYRGEGNTLDYIFVSNALNEQNNRAVGKVVYFVVYDEHLHSDGVGNKKQSDHAQPVVRIQLNTNHELNL
ncbi:endonuclease/exonuclease/phosphatase family protein [Vibrio proteolyticus]|uniref:Endonuclease/exonuclease/phosphatase domain-containing protein n=1 Tax=Vibrio proteolyticus NBRC 13287 TaxID=1219065 RepID=U3A1E2_VIBPR|nr:endonuclease/exonuclease/phosphatase family protein [Vibrio proteolyticus]GAD67510.1 hypothetical protein VPR01S_08_00920 [Vibrio proteolyticus NBRC 13287]